jgi:excisionase family DNA binding protein
LGTKSITPPQDPFRADPAGYGGRVARDRGDSPTLNLKQAAMALGVHYTTAYRYVRQGRLTARREGTEWRVSTEAVDQFRSSAASPAGARAASPASAGDDAADAADGPSSRPTGARGRRRGARWDERLAPALRAGDEPAAWRVVQQALDAGHDPAFCHLDMIAPALAAIDRSSALAGEDPSNDGDADQTAGASVPVPARAGEPDDAPEPTTQPSLDVVLATSVAQRLVARLGPGFRRPGRTRGTVVLGGPVGERHQLALSILADLIRGQGFGVLELGADVPGAIFVDAATTADRLVAVAVGVTGVDHLDNARHIVHLLREAEVAVPIVLGGQAVQNAEVADVIGADAWAPDGRRAAELIAALAERRRPART